MKIKFMSPKIGGSDIASSIQAYLISPTSEMQISRHCKSRAEIRDVLQVPKLS